MNFAHDQGTPAKSFTGIVVVVLLHVAIVYALLTGLARKVVEVVKQPIETKIIEEVKPPPPPEKTPPPPPPKLAAPPPPFIPPPEITVQSLPPQNTIAVVTNVKPESPVLPPPVAAPPVAVPVAAKAAPVRTLPVVEASGCEKPKYPRASLLAEETGMVMLALLVGADGRVTDAKIEKSSGYPRLDKAALEALSLCKFKPGTVDGKPEPGWAKLSYEWKLN